MFYKVLSPLIFFFLHNMEKISQACHMFYKVVYQQIFFSHGMVWYGMEKFRKLTIFFIKYYQHTFFFA
jgi:hypothetical protein